MRDVKNAHASTGLWQKVITPRVRGLQYKLIAPYLVLTLGIAAIGIFIATVLVVDSERERFLNSVMDASRVANDRIVQQEIVQLERLRYLIFYEGMAQAMYDRDSEQINEMIKAFLITQKVDLVSAIDQQGKDIITYGKDFSGGTYHIQQGVSFSALPSVKNVLEQRSDEQGDKFVEIYRLEQGAILFTSAPVRDGEGRLAGVMLAGSYIRDLLVDIKAQSLADVLLVDLNGETISSTLTGGEVGYKDLTAIVAGLDPAAPTRTIDVSLNERPYQVAYSPLIIRGQQVGWVGVVKNSEYLVSPAAQSRQMLFILFAVGSALVVIIGYFLAQSIARPLTRLRNMSQAVAAGDLDQSIGLHRSDEIGELGDAFDTMTLHLRERTAEAERLYEETLRRNRELAEINARLEAAQLQLIQSEKLAAIGQLTAGIVHDVKNPFAVIMGMAEVLGEEDNLDETTQRGLKVIRESAVKGNMIVSDLLKFARQSKPEMSDCDLRETIQTAMRLTAYLTRRYNTTVDLPDTPLILTYDAQLIEQVLINMIHNAVQSMPEKGEFKIRLWGEKDFAFISIQDSGCGIPPEHRKRIFDPFFTTKAEGEGTGLGLSVSYGIIANHHGKIEVESEVGKGSIFTIALPTHQQSMPQGDNNG